MPASASRILRGGTSIILDTLADIDKPLFSPETALQPSTEAAFPCKDGKRKLE
jgi:hypothetical protein